MITTLARSAPQVRRTPLITSTPPKIDPRTLRVTLVPLKTDIRPLRAVAPHPVVLRVAPPSPGAHRRAARGRFAPSPNPKPARLS
jgi:hypothetical protein